MKPVIYSAAASGWVGWALGVQLTLLQPGGADYSHHITACPPGFEHPAAALICNVETSQTICDEVTELTVGESETQSFT